MSEAKQELRPPLGSMWCRWQPLKEVEGCSVWGARRDPRGKSLAPGAR